MGKRRRSRFVRLAATAWVTVVMVALGAGCSSGDDARQTTAAAATAAQTPSPATDEPEPTVAPTPTALPTPVQEATPIPPPPTAAPEPTPIPVATPTPVGGSETEVFDARGPYAVGVQTYSLGDRDVEIWYPVDPDAVAGEPTEIFDQLSAFPETMQALIPKELSGEYDTRAVRDAAVALGAFPVVIYGHGFGGYRLVATNHTTHLASWGFVVASADHLERGIAEQTLDLIGQGVFDETNSRPDAAVVDVRDTIALLADLNEESSLSGSIDLDRLAITGHSAGAWAAVQSAAALPDRIDGWISISGGLADDTAPDQPGLVLIAEKDIVVPAERGYELFDAAVGPQLLVNILDTGHNAFTDPCRAITDNGGLGALTALLGEGQVARAEDGCTANSVEPEAVQAVVNHTTVAWLRDLFAISCCRQGLDAATVEAIVPLGDFRSIRIGTDIDLDTDGSDDRIVHLVGAFDGSEEWSLRFELASGTVLETEIPFWLLEPGVELDHARDQFVHSPAVSGPDQLYDIDRNGRLEYGVDWLLGPYWTTQLLVTWTGDTLAVIEAPDNADTPYPNYWAGGNFPANAACYDSDFGPLFIERSFAYGAIPDDEVDDLEAWFDALGPEYARALRLDGLRFVEVQPRTEFPPRRPDGDIALSPENDARFGNATIATCLPE